MGSMGVECMGLHATMGLAEWGVAGKGCGGRPRKRYHSAHNRPVTAGCGGLLKAPSKL